MISSFRNEQRKDIRPLKAFAHASDRRGTHDAVVQRRYSCGSIDVLITVCLIGLWILHSLSKSRPS